MSAAAHSSDQTNAVPAANLSLTELRDKLERLFSCHGNQFDPVRFHYIDAMARRAGQHSSTVRELVAQKALQALANYQTDFDRAKKRANEQLATIKQRFPDSAEIAQLQFAHSQFKTLQRLYDRLLKKTAEQSSAGLTLSDLSQLLANQQTAVNASNQGPALDLLLHQQENEIRQQLLPSQQPPQQLPEPAGKPSATAATEPRELHASRRFRQAQQKHTTRKVLNKAIHESPDSPGPLNPQMLALRALTRMQELSPDYLNRFVSYIDTLLWLEQSNIKTGKPARKKSSRRKSTTS
jgi:hypothetical protein